MITSAAVLTRSGATRPYAASTPLAVEELHLQDPSDGEVRVRVDAAGLCHSDLSVINGSRLRPLPMALGHEGAGVVEVVGRGVHELTTGDHVVFAFVPCCGRCVQCMSGRPALCEPGARANTAGTLLGGARRLSRSSGELVNHHLGVSCFATHAVVSAASLVPITATVAPQVAALFGCALLTGVGSVINTALVWPGSSVAIFGLGGVGMAALLGAGLASAHPIIVIDPSAEKRQVAEELGAAHALSPHGAVVQEIRELSAGGVDFVFDAAGKSEVLADAFTATRRGGTTVAVGLPRPGAKVELPAVVISAEERRIIGSYMGSAVPMRDVPRLIALYEAGRLPVERLLSRSIGMSEINRAFDALADGTLIRQVILPSE